MADTELEYRLSDEAADVMLRRPPRWLGCSIVVCAIGLASAIVLARFATIEEIVTVPQAVVRPAGDLVWIEPTLAGRLLEVEARAGEHVALGEVLFRLDARDAKSELRKVESKQAELKEQLRLRRRDATSLEREEQAASTRQSLELDGARLALAKARSDRECAAAALREAEAHVVEARANHDPSEQLSASGLVTAAELRLLKARLDIALADRDKAAMDLNGAEVELSVAENKIPTLETAAKESCERRSRELEQTRAEMAELEGELDRLALEEEDCRSLCGDFELRAPVAGTITSVAQCAAGQYLKAGDRLAAVAPEGAAWVVEALVPDRDAGSLPASTGATARLKFDAFPYRDYGILEGRLAHIDPDTTWNDQLGRVYRAIIALDSLELHKGQRRGHIRLGMQATVEIVKDRQPILAILLRKARDGVAVD
ncbi:MAG: HlyD family efflux transporter periplasmic adaptor subunit [Planctomycetota bacterium]